ncbi:Kelch repeat type 1-containing protein [Pseudomonas sp. StFLB209]|uniref:Kelch repeat-containing protein n=1 Tax=Pseudomonas sp. StFLB209 TaxID=1028989 RepID=UPI0004F7E16B|nr:phage tail protein [Pseudomonas sp. StFLB209]BAP41289.1 Kelch repeat type 1-containing protein [Pseudomonas sp. StFLB209]
MGASITLAGESLFAQKQAAKQTVDVTRFILANVPGLDTSKPVDRAAGLPAAEQIVHSEDVQHFGYLDANRVVYSLLMTSELGDFDFNWIGLQTAEGTLLIVAYVPLLQKRREIPPLQAGNNLTRNIVLEYNGAQALTGIAIPAKTWQFDYSVLFARVNDRLAAIETKLDKKLDLDNWTPPALVNLDGPNLVYPGSNNTYKITDYSIGATWAVRTSLGTLARTGDTITLTIPSGAAAGVVTLTVTRDGVDVPFKVALGAPAIAAPVITSPANNAANVGFEPTFALSAFTVYPTGYDTHKQTRLQVARDAAFTDLVLDETVATDLVNIALARFSKRLDPSKRYYTRGLFVGQTLQSAWSTVVTFNTASVYIRRPTITSPLDGAVKVSPSGKLTSDAFSVYGGSDTHASSRLQLSLKADFSTILYDSGFSTTQLISFQPPNALPFATLVYGRLKHKGATLGESEWSAVVSFTTSDILKGVYTFLNAGATARSFAASAVCNGQLYVYGGSNGGYPTDFWRYTPATNQWAQLVGEQTGAARSGATMVEFEGKLYLFGGGGDTSPTWVKTLRVYDPVAGTWTSKANAPSERISHSAVVIGRKMYVWGGIQYYNYGPAALWVYEFDTDKWVTIGERPALNYNGIDAVACVGKMYVYENGFFKAFNPADNTWAALTALPTRRVYGRLSEVDGKIYHYGGMTDNNTVIAELWVYDPPTDKWEQLPSGGGVRRSQSQNVINGEIYAFAGQTSAGFLNSFVKIA